MAKQSYFSDARLIVRRDYFDGQMISSDLALSIRFTACIPSVSGNWFTWHELFTLPYVYALTRTQARARARTRDGHVHANTMTTMQRWRASSFEPPSSSPLQHRPPPRILIELSPLLMRLRSVSVESLASELRASASVCVRACTGHAAASGTLLIYSRTR